MILYEILKIDISLADPLFYVFAALFFTFLIQFFYYAVVFGRLAFTSIKPIEKQQCQPLSVIICAKNEYCNLNSYLPAILEQDYPDFEVVVVNDGSEDDTEYLLKDLKKKYPHLTIVDFKKNVNFFQGKKFPLALGIRAAKNDVLVFTDADCYPRSNQWLKRMQSAYHKPQTEVVLGYSPYEKRSGLLNALIRFDTFFIAVQYLSYAMWGMPYMGVGRNLSYHRSLFIKNKGFSSHYQVASGDDDIFISQIAHKKNTHVVYDKEAQMVSLPKTSFKSWIKQKRRHFTTYSYYKIKHKCFLGFFSASNLMFYVLLLFLAIQKYNIVVLFALFILRVLIQYIVFKKCFVKLKEQNLLILTPLYDFLITLFNPLIVLLNFFSKVKKWK